MKKLMLILVVVGLVLVGSAQAATLMAHYDAGNMDGAGNNPADGGTVSSWADLSGNGWTAGSASIDPTYAMSVINGQSVVRFDGTQGLDTLLTLHPTLGTAVPQMTSISVAQRGNEAARGVIWTTDGMTGGNNRGMAFHQSLVLVETGTGPGLLMPPYAQDWVIVVTEYNFGTDVIANINNTTFASLGASETATANNDAVTFGYNPVTGTGQSLKGDIAEMMFYNGLLTDAELNAIGSSLAQKYDITTEFVPEPATMALLGLGSLVMLRRRKNS